MLRSSALQCTSATNALHGINSLPLLRRPHILVSHPKHGFGATLLDVVNATRALRRQGAAARPPRKAGPCGLASVGALKRSTKSCAILAPALWPPRAAWLPPSRRQRHRLATLLQPSAAGAPCRDAVPANRSAPRARARGISKTRAGVRTKTACGRHMSLAAAPPPAGHTHTNEHWGCDPWTAHNRSHTATQRSRQLRLKCFPSNRSKLELTRTHTKFTTRP